jgi:N-acetylglucosamine-6-phosphate deacetylase
MRIVDIHTHGLGDYDTRTTNPGDILKMAALQGAYGVTHMVPTIYSGAIEAMRENMAAVKVAMERQHTVFSEQRTARDNSKLKIQDSKSARIAGVHLEGPFLNPSKSGALDGSTFRKPSEKTLKKLLEGFEDIVKIITIAPELAGALGLIKCVSDIGIAVSLGHSDATFQEAEKAYHVGAKCITHLFNAMRGLHHREPGIAGFGLMNPDIFVEMIADPFHLDDRTIELVFKVKNPGKIIIVSDSVKETAVKAKNHAIQDRTQTLQGGSLTITESAKRLIGLGFDEANIMDCISANPWSYLLSGQ